MGGRFAVMDLGTNTFHLLVAELNGPSFQPLYQAEEFVKLGEEGLERIGEQAFRRGLEQIRKYKQVIDRFEPEKVIALGTAALRQAANADEFISRASEICPMDLRKISGDEEAELIYRGVGMAVPLGQRPVLIMDVGGGSTEFIIATSDQVFWKQSFPLGGSVLRHRFHHHEPIISEEIVHEVNYIQDQLAPLSAAATVYHPMQLVGAAGSFDTLAHIIAENISGLPLHPEATSTQISLREFYMAYERIVASNLEQRLRMKGMPWFRAEMIVVAMILAAFVIEKCHIRRITRSAYSLKEGLLWSLMQAHA